MTTEEDDFAKAVSEWNARVYSRLLQDDYTSPEEKQWIRENIPECHEVEVQNCGVERRMNFPCPRCGHEAEVNVEPVAMFQPVRLDGRPRPRFGVIEGGKK